MSTHHLRVALFTDCFRETNGVGTFCREYAEYARQAGLPFFCAYGGERNRFANSGSLAELELRRGPLSFPIDADLRCDPFLTRHRGFAVRHLREFRPDIVHVTGPGDVSILGLWAASLVGVPPMASWHTNVHEYARRRLDNSLAMMPGAMREAISRGAMDATLWAVTTYYKMAHFLAAPNQDMVNLLEERTNRPSYLMAHGVNTERFTPERRDSADPRFCIGYVGRLTPEKGARALADLERALIEAGESNFRMLIVGDGNEREWLEAHLRTAEFTGILHGDSLARAFANMDALVFPSLTDTFGLVILEAMASGVPVVVHPETGARVGVTDGVDGFLSRDFAASIRQLIRCPRTRSRMGTAASLHARRRAWSGVFEDLYRIYEDGLHTKEALRRRPVPKFDLAH